jgi:hypothetical protein
VHITAAAILAFPLPLFISVRALYYHSSCQDCSHLAITFKFMAAKILHQRWKQIINRIPPHINQEECRFFFSYEIISHVNLLRGQLSSFIDLVIHSLLLVVWANIIQLFINNLRTIKIQNVPITYL